MIIRSCCLLAWCSADLRWLPTSSTHLAAVAPRPVRRRGTLRTGEGDQVDDDEAESVSTLLGVDVVELCKAHNAEYFVRKFFSACLSRIVTLQTISTDTEANLLCSLQGAVYS